MSIENTNCEYGPWYEEYREARKPAVKQDWTAKHIGVSATGQYTAIQASEDGEQ